ncbi:phragmoplastin interacting protein 1-like isoform X3 [Wolffia australiana]
MKTQARRCTCWGILYYSTEDESFFQGCGTVTELDCMIFRESGKFTGIAVVSFKMEAATKRALRSVALTAAYSSLLNGRYQSVSFFLKKQKRSKLGTKLMS